jgi:hypothetical protein
MRFLRWLFGHHDLWGWNAYPKIRWNRDGTWRWDEGRDTKWKEEP